MTEHEPIEPSAILARDGTVIPYRSRRPGRGGPPVRGGACRGPPPPLPGTRYRSSSRPRVPARSSPPRRSPSRPWQRPKRRRGRGGWPGRGPRAPSTEAGRPGHRPEASRSPGPTSRSAGRTEEPGERLTLLGTARASEPARPGAKGSVPREHPAQVVQRHGAVHPDVFGVRWPEAAGEQPRQRLQGQPQLAVGLSGCVGQPGLVPEIESEGGLRRRGADGERDRAGASLVGLGGEAQQEPQRAAVLLHKDGGDV